MLEDAEGTWAQYQKLVLKLLEQHDEKLEELVKSLKDDSGDRTLIKSAHESLKCDVSLLLSIVRDGTAASPPILHRLDKVEGKLEEMRQTMEKAAEQKEMSSKDTKIFKRALIISITGFILSTLWDVIQGTLLKSK